MEDPVGQPIVITALHGKDAVDQGVDTEPDSEHGYERHRRWSLRLLRGSARILAFGRHELGPYPGGSRDGSRVSVGTFRNLALAPTADRWATRSPPALGMAPSLARARRTIGPVRAGRIRLGSGIARLAPSQLLTLELPEGATIDELYESLGASIGSSRPATPAWSR